MKGSLRHVLSAFIFATAALAGLGCRHIYVPDTEESTDEPPVVEPPGPCSELVWERDEPLALDPLSGVNGSLHRLVPTSEGAVLVSTRADAAHTRAIITTRISDPWGDLIVSAPVERGTIGGPVTVAAASTGELSLYTAFFDWGINTSQERVVLPPGDGPGAPAEILTDVVRVVWDDHGWQGLLLRETLDQDQDGLPTAQRVTLLDASSMSEIASYSGGPLEFFKVVQGFAGGALVSFYDDWNDGEPQSFQQWVVRADGTGAFAFDGYRWFGHDAAGTPMVVTADAEVLALELDGSVKSSFGLLPSELQDTQGQLTIVPWEAGHALVSVKKEQGALDGELRVRAYPSPDRELISEPLPANELDVGDPFAVLPGPDGKSLLVAYEQTPAFTGARLARLTCR